MVTAKVGLCIQNEVHQEESDQGEFDGTKKGAESTCNVMHDITRSHGSVRVL